MNATNSKLFFAACLALVMVGCETQRKATTTKKPATAGDQPTTTDVPSGRIDDTSPDYSDDSSRSSRYSDPNSTTPQGSISSIQMGTDPRDSILWDGLSDVDQSGKLVIRNVAVSNSAN